MNVKLEPKRSHRVLAVAIHNNNPADSDTFTESYFYHELSSTQQRVPLCFA